MPSIELEPRAAAAVVAEAREWVGTPYRHQGNVKGRAVDCVGLILGVGHAVGLLDIRREQWAEFANYSRTPNPRKMGEAMERFLDALPIGREEEPPEGAVGWFGWRDD